MFTVPAASKLSSPLPPVNISTPVVKVFPTDGEADPTLLIKTTALETVLADESNTLTLIPSIPSTTPSLAAPMLKVVEDAPAAIVAVPETASRSEVPALSTVEPFSPAALFCF